MPEKLILASVSPRRQELLRSAAIAFTVEATDIPEIPQPGEAAKAFTERLAREKACAIAAQHPAEFVLGADTTVVVDNQILNKPEDDADAKRMLHLLSGRKHQVITGVCLIGPSSGSEIPPIHDRAIHWRSDQSQLRTAFEDIRSETTAVTFERLTDEEIDYYVTTGEPMDKAGAYAIQGIASRWISKIEGDYANVVGLPVALVYRLLREHGALR